MDVNINTHKHIEIPTEAKAFITERLNALSNVHIKILSCKVRIKDIKNAIECQIKIVPAYMQPIVVKSSALSIKTAFLDAYHKVDYLLLKSRHKIIDKKQKSNLGEII